MTGLILLHFVVMSLHGVAHQRMGIHLEPWQRAFVGSVIFAGPLIALAALWMFRKEVGTVLLALSMAGSLMFGTCYHFFLSTSDNVFYLGQSGWAHWFMATAVLLAIIEMACCVWCVWTLGFGRGNGANPNRSASEGNKQNIRKPRQDALSGNRADLLGRS